MSQADSLKTLAQILEAEVSKLGNEFAAGYPSRRAALESNLAGNSDPVNHERERNAFVQRELHGLAQERAALCLSGGGIRSATFNLGILQALAGADLLGKFDFLSTVSGGGYVGSWLSAWIHNEKNGRQAVFAALKDSVSKSPDDPKFAPITHLREYSNYLSPKLGILSADTWTLVAAYLRNLLLNWLVLIPVIVLVLMIPRWCVWGTVWMRNQSECVTYVSRGVLFGLACICQIIAVAYLNKSRISVDKSDTQSNFLKWCLCPLVMAAGLLSMAWVTFFAHSAPAPGSDQLAGSPTVWWKCLWVFLVFQSVLALSGWIVAVIFLLRQRRSSKDQSMPWKGLFWELLAVMAAALITGWLTWVFATSETMNPAKNPLAYVVLALPLYLLALLLSGVVLNGVSSFWMLDEKREWSARAGAWMLIASCTWLLFSAIGLIGPSLFLCLHLKQKSLFASGGTLAGVLTAILGHSAKTPANPTQQVKVAGFIPLQWLLAVAAVIFIICLLTFLSLGTDWLVIHFYTPAILLTSFPIKDWHLTVLLNTNVLQLGCWTIGFCILECIASSFVNVNKFSLYAIYRNRLVRAYLAASRKVRDDLCSFTGFATADNIPLHELAKREDEEAKPFHVINITLNLVNGTNLAWQERKAESFTASCLHCGSADLGYRPTQEYGGGYWGGLRPHTQPSQAVSLGSAMAISGAAASPNMGYHSSPLISILMTLFNVRLGVWLGNPGPAGDSGTKVSSQPSWGQLGPDFAARPLFEEALGLTDSNNRYVNLSDGGHFENLGLYEMVRRRCHCIVVSDAGEDPSYSFEDLANAIRKIYIDMGIEIRFDGAIPIYARSSDPSKPQRPGGYCSIATIYYQKVDQPTDGSIEVKNGQLVYLKPAFYGDEPTDIYNYAMASDTFPNETTANQFFTESQFESYRKLGHYIGQKLFVPDEKLTNCEAILKGPQAYQNRSAQSSPPQT